MLLDMNKALLLMVYLTYKYNAAITCMCPTHHLRSLFNLETPKMQMTQGSNWNAP